MGLSTEEHGLLVLLLRGRGWGHGPQGGSLSHVIRRHGRVVAHHPLQGATNGPLHWTSQGPRHGVRQASLLPRHHALARRRLHAHVGRLWHRTHGLITRLLAARTTILHGSSTPVLLPRWRIWGWRAEVNGHLTMLLSLPIALLLLVLLQAWLLPSTALPCGSC